ncbi:hypothetical protein HanIR_Chr14g0722811 [Helianthus annuus]|nr:hypothetical protein HanIR_Chr14g0722811 [Helianthus annuus]
MKKNFIFNLNKYLYLIHFYIILSHSTPILLQFSSFFIKNTPYFFIQFALIMNPFNPNNPNPNNPNPNNPIPNQANFFSSPAYTPTMDPSWRASQFPFSGFQQTPNAFSQMSQLQQMQQYQALQQIMQRNTFEQLQSQPQPPVQLDDDDEEVVPESPPQELTRKKNKGKGKKVENVPETAPKTVREQRGDLGRK